MGAFGCNQKIGQSLRFGLKLLQAILCQALLGPNMAAAPRLPSNGLSTSQAKRVSKELSRSQHGSVILAIWGPDAWYWSLIDFISILIVETVSKFPQRSESQIVSRGSAETDDCSMSTFSSERLSRALRDLRWLPHGDLPSIGVRAIPLLSAISMTATFFDFRTPIKELTGH